jgi:hypothetical protein
VSSNITTNLFDSRLFTWRAVLPPPLRGEDRARLVSRLSAAVRQQAALAEQCVAVLRASGRVEESGEYILLEHEPAAPLIVTASGLPPAGLDIETLQWLAATGGLALAEAQRAGLAHGGVMPGGFHQDRVGLAQLGDFGIAAALESVCGTDRRREIFLDPVPREIDGRLVSGCWTLLHERERRDFGWIAPFFAHELLDGRVRLNPRGDRFALGVVLHHLATGRHPYHIDFSDPTLRLYFTLEAPPPEDDRPDWREALKKADGAAKGRERRLKEWCRFEQRLCASEASQRWNEPEALEQACSLIAPESWREAANALRAGLRQLDAGGPAAILDAAAATASAGLPPAWRRRLDVLVRDVERTRADIEARAAVGRDLDAARAAVDDMDLPSAQRLARAVIDSPLAEPDQKAGAAEVLDRCADLAKSVESGADQFARSYLESAADALARGDVEDARQTLTFVINDTGTPAPRIAQARQLLSDVEALAAVYERHDAELVAAERDRNAGRYDAAAARLDALLSEPKLREAVASAATALRTTVAELHERRQQYVVRLDDAQKAWERADPEALHAAIQAVPDDFADPTIVELRTELRAKARTLTAALQTRASAVAAAEKGEIEAALRHATRISPHAVLPRAFRDELNERIRGWTSRLEELRREAVSKATAALESAETDYLEGREREAARRVETAVLSEIALPLEARDRAERLLERCRRALDARRRLAEADAALASGDLAVAARAAAEFDLAELTPKLLQDVEAFDARLEKAKALRLEEERGEWRRRAESIAEALSSGRLDEAETALAAGTPRAEIGPEIADRWRKLSDILANGRAIATRIESATKRLHQSADGPALCGAELDKIPTDAPPWARQRVTALRAEAAAIVDRQRREVEARAAARQKEIDDALAELATDLGALTRQNRRVRGRILNWSREAELNAAQKTRVAELLRKHDSLTDRRKIPWPLISSVGLVVLFVSGGLWWWLSTASNPVPKPEPKPPVVVVPEPEPKPPVVVVPEPKPQETPQPTTEPTPKVVTNDEPTTTLPVEPPRASGPSPEAIAAYQDAVRNGLPERVSATLAATGDSAFRVAAEGSATRLIPFDGVSWNADNAAFEPAADSVASYFQRQIAAVQAVGDGSAAIHIDAAYDARIRWKSLPAQLEIRSITERGVEIRGRAQLDGDPLPDPDFAVAGVVTGSEFVADDTSKAAFEGRVRNIRSAQIERFTADDLPPGFRFSPPVGFAGGATATLGIVDASGKRVGTLEARWDAQTLAFAADPAALAAARTSALRSTLDDQATVDRLATVWNADLRAPLAEATEVGNEYLSRSTISAIRLNAAAPPAAAVPVTVKISTENAAAEDSIEFAVTLQAVDGQLTWPRATDADLRSAVASALGTRNDDPAFRSRRRAEVLAAVAREAGVTTDDVKVEPGPTPDALAALAGAPDPTRYTLAWNARAFRYDIAERTAPPPVVPPPTTTSAPTPKPAGIESTLRERLGSDNAVDLDPAAFGSLYADVVRRKLERFGAAEYRPRESLGSAAAAASPLLEISNAAQSLVAPNSSTERYPVVFVEFFVTEQDVYGLAWHAKTAGSNTFSGVDSMRLWKVMPAASLAAAADAASVRRLFENPTNGEALLGPALGTGIEGSLPGDAGSFGLAVAPDGPLWLVRWDLVQFSSRPVSNIAKLNGGNLPGSATQLRDLLSYQIVERALEFRRVGIWCFPTLGGRWTGGTPPRLSIGLPGTNAQLRFARGGRDRGMLYARIEDASGDDSTWAGLSTRLSPTNIGYLFWNDGWNSPRDWTPRKTTSVALILP